jgi:hypothetical protein
MATVADTAHGLNLIFNNKYAPSGGPGEFIVVALFNSVVKQGELYGCND